MPKIPLALTVKVNQRLKMCPKWLLNESTRFPVIKIQKSV